ncbi:hypothetical protein [uncultured Salinisphaera sp.]
MYPDIRYRDWLFIDGVYNAAPDFEQSMPLRNAHVFQGKTHDRHRCHA